MITNINIDTDIVAEAIKLSGARTKREVVDRAVREMVERFKRPSVRQLFGIGGVEPDYDPKVPGARGVAAGQFRVEQARGHYAVAAKTPSKPKPVPARKRK